MIFRVLSFLNKYDQFLSELRTSHSCMYLTLNDQNKIQILNGGSSEALKLTFLFIIFIFRYLVAKRMVVKVLLMNQWQVKRQGNFKAWFTTWWWVFSICLLIPKFWIWIFTNFLTNENKFYKSCFFWVFFDRNNLIDQRFCENSGFVIGHWIRSEKVSVLGFVIVFRTDSFQLKCYDFFPYKSCFNFFENTSWNSSWYFLMWIQIIEYVYCSSSYDIPDQTDNVIT